MTKTKRLLSMLLAVIMVLSAVSGFAVTTSAAGVSDSATKAAAELNKFIYSPMKAVKISRFASSVPSGILFVCKDWSTAKDGDTVYMDYSGEIYKAIKGVNAFDTIGKAFGAGSDNMTVKVGPGTYSEGTSNEPLSVKFAGMKIYGNYAGVDPNVDTDVVYVKNLNPVRNPSLESVINASMWTWVAGADNFLMDGFKITGQTSSIYFKACASGAHIYGFEMRNCIIDGCQEVVNTNYGHSNGVYFRNNRIVNGTGSYGVLYAGAGMKNIIFENNYSENCDSYLLLIVSYGNSDQPGLISLSNNIFNNCKKVVNFRYKVDASYNGHYDYKSITNNIFYNSGHGNDKFIIGGQYLLEACNPASKTLIRDNLFYSIPTGVYPISLTGANTDASYPGEFIVNIIDNKFVYASSNAKLMTSSLKGTVDISHNYYGYLNSGEITPLGKVPDMSKDVKGTTVIPMPYYADYEMTTLAGGVDFNIASQDVLTALGFDCATYGADAITVDNKEMKISAQLAQGVESAKFAGTVSGKTENALTVANSDIQIYTDFLLSRPVQDLTVDLIGDITKTYLVVTNKTTGESTKYYLALNTTTDKTKSEIRNIVDETTIKYHDNYTIADKNINVILDSKYIYFPFTLVVSPSASYKLYTDSALTKEYDDTSYYIKPDADVVLYAKVTSGDGTNNTVYTLTFNRQGADLYDASVSNVVSPAEDVIVFRSRRIIVYRPTKLLSEVKFDFDVTRNASYNIYKEYNEETGVLSGLATTSEEDKAVPVGDGINYYYAEIISEFGYSQVYTIVIYNDVKVEEVKSDDNVITGITGIDQDVRIENNVIYVEASPTVTAVNAHFKTDIFATVEVYADEARTYKLTPEVSYTIVQKQEIPIRTFRLGITSRVAYYYLDSISESGLKDTYKVVITKEAEAADFIDTEKHWAKEYIDKVGSYGIINGYYNEDKDEYTFQPNSYVNRQEVAAMLCRMMGIDQMAFKDGVLTGIFADASSIPDWSYNYVKGVYFLNIMVGSDNANGERVFNYAAKITRQEIFQAISNILDLDTNAAASVDLSKFKDGKDVASWAVPATKAVIKAGIIEGDSNNKLNPKANITRAEMTKIIALTNLIHTELE